MEVNQHHVNRLDFWARLDNYRKITNYNICLSCVIIAPLGLLLNALFFLVLLRVKSMRTGLNLYLANLAIADSLYLLISFLPSALYLFKPSTLSNISQLWFQILVCLEVCFQAASVSFVTAIAVERFRAVRQPIIFRATASRARSVKILAGVWMVGLGYGAAVSALLDKSQESTLASQIIRLAFFLCNASLTGCLYVYLVLRLNKRPATIALPSTNRTRPRHRTLAMLVFNTAVFYLLNSVVIVSIAVDMLAIRDGAHFQLTFRTLFDLNACCFVLSYINSSVNSFIYSITNAKYRSAVRECFSSLLPRCCANGRRHDGTGRRRRVQPDRPLRARPREPSQLRVQYVAAAHTDANREPGGAAGADAERAPRLQVTATISQGQQVQVATEGAVLLSGESHTEIPAPGTQSGQPPIS